MIEENNQRRTIAIIGGTGDLGRGLAIRCAAAGYTVIIGSRSAERAQSAAKEIAEIADSVDVRGADYEEAASLGDIVILTVPYAAHQATLERIRDHVQDKVVIDCTVPLKPPKVMRVQLPEAGSAAREARNILGDGVHLTAAFHNVAATKLAAKDGVVDCDVLVFGDASEARDQVVSLIEAIGLKGWHAGPLDNAVIAEALTSTLIFLNKRYNIDGAGIRITGESAS